MSETKPRIFCFINSGAGTDWVQTVAIAEDGHCVGGHTSSSNGWAKRDITAEWKHDKFSEHYPNGWEIEWVDDPRKHAGLALAFERNRELREAPANG